jgi:hypothetical protein
VSAVVARSARKPIGHTRWQQLQAAGGTTGYRDLFVDAKERADALAQRNWQRSIEAQRAKLLMLVLDWLSDYNEAMENAVRTSAFSNGKTFRCCCCTGIFFSPCELLNVAIILE